MFSQYSPTSGFQLTIWTHLTPCAWATLAHVSVRSALSWYGLQILADGMHSVPDVGKLAQKAFRLLAVSRLMVLMPCLRAME
jgi:hypothetical protein